MERSKDIIKRYQKASFVWGAITGGVLIYSVVILMVESTSDFGRGFPSKNVIYWKLALAVMTIISLFLVLRFRSFFLKRVPPTASPVLFLDYLLLSSVFEYAACEAIALYGLAIFFITEKWIDFLPFAAVSLAALLFRRPKLTLWQKLVSERFP